MPPNGIVFYEGASQIDGSPVAAIATGLVVPSRNVKTGPMVQSWYLRTDLHPFEAIQSGADDAICGSCVHRGHVERGEDGKYRNVERTCYVPVMNGPHSVFTAYRRGLYEGVTPVMAQRYLTNRRVRIGAYGDPGAIPSEIHDVVLARAEAVTGYTHLWSEYPELARWCMASVESEEEREAARRLGFRTFRVRSKDDPTLRGEGQCPASAEMSKVLRCNECLLCTGTSSEASADITIQVHGRGAGHFAPRRILQAA